MQLTPRIVITGGPASGKSCFLERLRGEPILAGFLFLEEVARQVLAENPDIRNRWLDFHREVYRRQTEQIALAGDRPFITDRGTPDTFAFCPHHLADLGTSLDIERHRYTAAIQLGSAANLGESFYVTDSLRTETPERALEIERAITAVWRPHPHYRFVPADPDFDRKYDRLLQLIRPLAQS